MSAWKIYDDKFDALSNREKWLALLVGLVVICLVGYTYIVEPLFKENGELETKINTSTIQLNSIQSQKKIYQDALSVDPDAEYKAQLAQLQKRMTDIEQKFSVELEELVSPAMMPALMNEVLSLSGSLSLETMETIAPVNVFEGKPNMEDVALYQHAIRLTFSGGYQQVQQFLAKLESTNWQVYWRAMEYDVSEYPDATLVVEFYTLSTNKEFLRV